MIPKRVRSVVGSDNGELKTMVAEELGVATSLAFSPNGLTPATGYRNGTIAAPRKRKSAAKHLIKLILPVAAAQKFPKNVQNLGSRRRSESRQQPGFETSAQTVSKWVHL